MLFNSFSFLVFFPVTVGVHYALPYKFRRHWLLIASCYFYASFVPEYLLILFALIGIDYTLARCIGSTTAPRTRKWYLVLSMGASLGMLFVFKYFNFFNANVGALAEFLGWNYSLAPLEILLPLGLSFHVFQSLSYVIEVYRGKYEPERNLITYALYVMFFPQLVAGPIERPQHLLPQLNTTPAFNAVGVRHGLELMLVGFFKKVVIADQLAPLVDHLFTPDITHNGAALLIASAAFTYQLYCDFSGYSDIAVGAALVLGYNLVQNFNRPFAARSIAEFWRRWHISLSSWLRDYLYYPLAFGGAHVTKVRLYMSTLITFVLIGLWHGANWTYVVMGALHGIYLVSSALTEKLRAAIVRATHIARVPWLFALWQTGCVFLLVMVSFIFFRATSLSHALSILTDVLRAPFDYPYLLAHWSELVTVTGVGIGLKGVLIAICALELHQYFQEKKSSPYIFDTAPRFIRILWYYVLLFAVLGLGYFGEHAFIYFQF